MSSSVARLGASLLVLALPLVPARPASAAHPQPDAPAAAPPPAAVPAPDTGTHAVKLRDLESRIEELAEQVRRTRARIALLGDALFVGGDAGARASIDLGNEMSDAFIVTRVVVILDGALQYKKVEESGVLARHASVPIFEGAVQPGDHTLQVVVNLQGNGFGIFSYLRGYRFELRSTHSFTAVEGKTIDLHAVAFEKGTTATPLEERPALRYGEAYGAIAPRAAASPPK